MLRILFFSLLLCFYASSTVYGQMFSMTAEEERKKESPLFQGFDQLFISWAPATFTYTGNFEGTNELLFLPLDFDGSLVFVGYETEYTLVELGYGASFTGLDNNTDFLSLYLSNFRPLLRFGNQRSNLFIPIGLTIDYTRVGDSRSSQIGNNLNQSGFLGGTGLRYTFEGNKWIVFTGADINYGFSFADGSAYRGASTRFNIPLRVMLKDFWGTKDLSLGYTYRFKDFNILNDPSERFDYDLSMHQLTLGIRF